MVEHDRESNTFADFLELLPLDIETLRGLLDSGEEVERVWAAWALALKLGRHSAPTLAAVAQSEVPAGLRRHLIAVLAGFGETEILSVFATSDPDSLVRGTACLYLIQTSEPDNEKMRNLMFSRLDREPDPKVRGLVISKLSEIGSSILLPQLIVLSQDPSAEVRRLALQSISRQHSSRRALESGLEKCLETENEPDLLLLLAEFLITERRAVGLIQCAGKLDDQGQRQLIDRLFECEMVLSWNTARQFIDLSDYRLVEFWKIVDSDELPMMFHWLVAKLAACVQEENWCSSSHYLLLVELLVNLDLSDVCAATLGYLDALQEAVRFDLSNKSADLDPDEIEWQTPLGNDDLSRLDEAITCALVQNRL